MFFWIIVDLWMIKPPSALSDRVELHSTMQPFEFKNKIMIPSWGFRCLGSLGVLGVLGLLGVLRVLRVLGVLGVLGV